MTKKILILGASGFLGKILSKNFKLKKYKVIKQSRKKNKFIKINLNNRNETLLKLNKINPDIIINSAALTDVEKCQSNYKNAYNANVLILKNINFYLKKNKSCRLINISTDHVYFGKGPHKETRVAPVNNYALTKYLGELEANESKSTNLRVNFVGKSQSSKKSLTDWFVDSCRLKKKIYLYKNVFFSPLEVKMLCDILIKIVEKKKITGTFNVGSQSGISKSKFLRKIGKKLNLNLSKVKDINIKKIKHLTKRPFDMRLNTNSFKKTFKINLPKIDSVIDRVCLDYTNYNLHK